VKLPASRVFTSSAFTDKAVQEPRLGVEITFGVEICQHFPVLSSAGRGHVMGDSQSKMSYEGVSKIFQTDRLERELQMGTAL
jgi:hypothetical protein